MSVDAAYVNNTISKYSETYDLFDGYVENLNKILYNIGDVIEPVEPNSENIYTELEEYITREKQKMQQYHELDELFCYNELSDFEQRIDALTEYISGIRKNYSERKAYISGDIQQMPEYQVCKENLEKHMEYQAENEGAIQAASELYIEVNTKVAADNRAHAGWQKVFTGTGLLWLGGAAIATAVGGPAGASVAATAWGSIIGVSGTVTAGFGFFDTIEGGQDIKYGIKGDIYTESFNPYKDLLGEENYYKAEKMSANITGGLLTVDMVYNIGKGRWWGKSEVEANVEPAKIESTETAKIEATEAKIVELKEAKISIHNEIEQVTGSEILENRFGEVTEIETVTVESSGSIGEAGLVENEAGETFQSRSGVNPSSKKLRENMIESGKVEPSYKNAAHHIVAGSSQKAAEARSILEKYDIDINSADNGVFLPTEKGVSNASYHPSLHTNEYYRKVNSLLNNANSREDVLDILDMISDDLLDGSF